MRNILENIPNPTIQWAAVGVTWVAGDLLTTYIGLQIGLIENAPVAQHVLESGFEALIIFKLLFTSIMYVAFAYLRMKDKLFAIGIPIGLTLIGSLVTIWNTLLILTTI